jgi:transposase
MHSIAGKVMTKRGRPSKLTEAVRTELLAIVEANPTFRWEELRIELDRRTGIELHTQTIHKQSLSVTASR